METTRHRLAGNAIRDPRDIVEMVVDHLEHSTEHNLRVKASLTTTWDDPIGGNAGVSEVVVTDAVTDEEFMVTVRRVKTNHALQAEYAFDRAAQDLENCLRRHREITEDTGATRDDLVQSVDAIRRTTETYVALQEQIAARRADGENVP